MKIFSFKSPKFFSPLFRWLFWRQLKRNRCCYGNPYCDDCYDYYGYGYGLKNEEVKKIKQK